MACLECGAEIVGRRSDALYCSEVHRKRAASREHVRVYRARHGVKQRPYDSVKERAWHAAQRSQMVREPCLFCDRTDVQAHHHDYSKPLDVTWLCSVHHALVHKVVAA